MDLDVRDEAHDGEGVGHVGDADQIPPAEPPRGKKIGDAADIAARVVAHIQNERHRHQHYEPIDPSHCGRSPLICGAAYRPTVARPPEFQKRIGD